MSSDYREQKGCWTRSPRFLAPKLLPTPFGTGPHVLPLRFGFLLHKTGVTMTLPHRAHSDTQSMNDELVLVEGVRPQVLTAILHCCPSLLPAPRAVVHPLHFFLKPQLRRSRPHCPPRPMALRRGHCACCGHRLHKGACVPAAHLPLCAGWFSISVAVKISPLISACGS